MTRHKVSLGPSMQTQAKAMERILRSYEKRAAKWPWQDFLTDEEHAELQRAEDAKKRWQELNKGCASIKNRALQRAKYAAGAR